MQIDIDSLTADELLALNQRIVVRLRFLESVHQHQEMLQFRIGQRVSFEPAGRGRQIGTLAKFNQKTVTVVTEAGQKWNVSPQLLSAVKDVGTAQPQSKAAELFPKA